MKSTERTKIASRRPHCGWPWQAFASWTENMLKGIMLVISFKMPRVLTIIVCRPSNRLSSGQWSKLSESRPLCANHDDGVTTAMIQCETCQSLCADCDRFLHLNRKTRNHRRTVCKEEEDAIRVELHEGCGRTKLFWLLALADSRTLKAIIEFRDGNLSTISGATLSMGKCSMNFSRFY